VIVSQTSAYLPHSTSPRFYPSPLTQFLAVKVAEYKDSTARALQPEVGRLHVEHEGELAEVHRQLKQRERTLTEGMGFRLQGRLEEERSAAKEELKLSASVLQDREAGDSEGAEREHYRVLQRLGRDQERELDRRRQLARERGEQHRQQLREEERRLLEVGQQRVAVLKQQHAHHLEKLLEEHDRRVRAGSKWKAPDTTYLLPSSYLIPHTITPSHHTTSLPICLSLKLNDAMFYVSQAHSPFSLVFFLPLFCPGNCLS
jgi:hypothetical protein